LYVSPVITLRARFLRRIAGKRPHVRDEPRLSANAFDHFNRSNAMTSLQLQSKSMSITEAIACSPIILAFVIGSIPVLIPALIYRCLVRGQKTC